MNLHQRAKHMAKRVQRELAVVRCVLAHAETPLLARLWLGVVLAYAVSPLDLIPDFIPVLGYVDDLVLIPLGLWLAWRMVPGHVLRHCRERVWEGVE